MNHDSWQVERHMLSDIQILESDDAFALFFDQLGERYSDFELYRLVEIEHQSGHFDYEKVEEAIFDPSIKQPSNWEDEDEVADFVSAALSFAPTA